MPNAEGTAEFIDYLRSELRCSPLTAKAYERDLRQFAAFIAPANGIVIPDLVTSHDIRAWIGSMADRGDETTTLRRKLQSLRAFFTYGMKTGGAHSNPASDITLPKKKKRLPNFIRENELEELLSEQSDSFEAARSHIVVELLYTLGLRRAEAIALTDSDVRPGDPGIGNGEIRVTGKRGKTRLLPLPKELADDISRWQRLRDERYPDLQSPKPIIAGPHGAVSANTFHRIVRDALSSTSTGRKSPHTLRHSFATAMISSGADLNCVRELLGHESLATTQIYTHLSVNELMAGYKAAHPRSIAATTQKRETEKRFGIDAPVRHERFEESERNLPSEQNCLSEGYQNGDEKI